MRISIGSSALILRKVENPALAGVGGGREPQRLRLLIASFERVRKMKTLVLLYAAVI
jgi:hypothetical protein